MGGVREREKGERHRLTVCVYVHEFDKSYTRAELAEEEPERNTVKTFCVDLEINQQQTYLAKPTETYLSTTEKLRGLSPPISYQMGLETDGLKLRH